MAASAHTVGERRLTLGQAYISADVAYALDNFEPYARGGYRYDVSMNDGASAGGLPGACGNPQPQDPGDIQWGMALRYFGPRGLTAQAQWMTTAGRELFDDDRFSVLVRIDC